MSLDGLVRVGGFPDNAAFMLLERAAVLPEKPAVVDSQGVATYGDVAACALAITGALGRFGVEMGDRVAIFLPRTGAAAAAFFGVLASGAIAVIVNESLRPRQIEHVLNHADARLLLTSPEMINRLPRALETRALVALVGEIDPSGRGHPVSRVGNDVAQIVYTSGSTGLPKGVTISHGNLWAGMQTVVRYLGIRSDDRIASLLPFSFDYGLNQLLCCAGTGATLVVERSPVPLRIVRALREREVTVLPAVPPLWLQLLDVPAFREERLERLRLMTNTGGRLPPDAVRKLRRSQPQGQVVLMYGLTEAFRSTYLAPSKVDDKPESIGAAIPGAEVLVVRDDLAPCEPGEIGELVHRGPTVALGYWNDPEATSGMFRPHPLRPPGTPDSERVVFSGDLVYRDEEGDLFFVGRRDRMIKTLGYRVSPDEVVDVLYASGQVVEAVVASEQDDELGARIVAYVVLTETGEVEQVEAFCAAEMPRYLRPSRIEVRSSLDRTPSGKFDVTAIAKESGDSV
jgi:amino acid adenylation domain-containing protein